MFRNSVSQRYGSKANDAWVLFPLNINLAFSMSFKMLYHYGLQITQRNNIKLIIRKICKMNIVTMMQFGRIIKKNE